MKSLISIQIARAFAAILVAAYHFEAHLQETFLKIKWSALSQFGFFGVDIFFVISGFVVWHSTINKKGAHAVAIFLYNRFARIYSTYWLVILFYLIVMWLGTGSFSFLDGVGQMASIFLFPQREDQMQLVPVAWSLCFELYFYALFALLILFPLKKRIIYIFIYVAIMLIIYLTLYFNYQRQAIEYFSGYLPWVILITSPYLLEFLFGVFLCFFYHKKRALIESKSILFLFLFFLCVLYVAAFLSIYGIALHQTSVILRVATAGILAIFFILLLLSLEPFFIKNINYFSFISLLGDGSYSIYLLHNILYGIGYFIGFRKLAFFVSEKTNLFCGVILMVLYLIISIIFSAWIGVHIEKKIYRKIKI